MPFPAQHVAMPTGFGGQTLPEWIAALQKVQERQREGHAPAPLHGIMLGGRMPHDASPAQAGATIERMLHVQGDPMQERFQEERAHIGTSTKIDLLAAIQGALAQHFFTGNITAMQVQDIALYLVNTQRVPLQFVRDTLRAIGYVPTMVPRDQGAQRAVYGEPKKLPEAFEEEEKPYDVALPPVG